MTERLEIVPQPSEILSSALPVLVSDVGIMSYQLSSALRLTVDALLCVAGRLCLRSLAVGRFLAALRFTCQLPVIFALQPRTGTLPCSLVFNLLCSLSFCLCFAASPFTFGPCCRLVLGALSLELQAC